MRRVLPCVVLLAVAGCPSPSSTSDASGPDLAVGATRDAAASVDASVTSDAGPSTDSAASEDLATPPDIAPALAPDLAPAADLATAAGDLASSCSVSPTTPVSELYRHGAAFPSSGATTLVAPSGFRVSGVVSMDCGSSSLHPTTTGSGVIARGASGDLFTASGSGGYSQVLVNNVLTCQMSYSFVLPPDHYQLAYVMVINSGLQASQFGMIVRDALDVCGDVTHDVTVPAPPSQFLDTSVTFAGFPAWSSELPVDNLGQPAMTLVREDGAMAISHNGGSSPGPTYRLPSGTFGYVPLVGVYASQLLPLAVRPRVALPSVALTAGSAATLTMPTPVTVSGTISGLVSPTAGTGQVLCDSDAPTGTMVPFWSQRFRATWSAGGATSTTYSLLVSDGASCHFHADADLSFTGAPATNENGAGALELPTAGAAPVTFSANATRDVAVPPASSVTVNGRLVDGAGSPLAGYALDVRAASLSAANLSGDGFHASGATTDASGAFVLHTPASADVTLHFRKP